jgi:hypothetical protein
MVVQHHDVPSATLMAAPVTRPVPGDLAVLAPPIGIDGTDYRVCVLDISAVPRGMIGETVAPLAADADGILAALDVVLHGYPVGRPD